MFDQVWSFLDASGFQPHGACLLWRPGIFWTHVVADAVIALSYLTIPIALYRLARRRADIRYSGLLHLYAAFIITCGITHLFGIWTMWVPDYGTEAVAKVITAAVSAGVAIAMWPLLPDLIAIPSAAELAAMNAALIAENEERRAAENKAADLVDALRRSNADLETFAQAAAHDLKEPLRAIGAAASWFEEDLDPETRAKVRPTLDIMTSRVARMTRLLNDLLIHARVGCKDTPIRHVTGEALMDKVLDLITLPPGFAVGSDPALAKAVVPVMPCWMILLNLVSNAIKHHDRETGRVHVGFRDLGTAFEFSVEDDGPGIPPRFHGKVFEVFQTLRTRDEMEGSGLGLSMVRKAVETSGGTIALHSDGVRGTCVVFSLPKAPGHGARAGDAPSAEAGGEAEGSGGRSTFSGQLGATSCG